MSFSIRPECDDKDRRFIEGLNGRLTEVSKAPAHTSNEIESFQKAFAAMAGGLDGGKGATFLAVEETGNRIGYVHVGEGSDEVLEEACGYSALLAVEQEHEGRGVAKALVEQAELWAREMGFSRLALDVFASNDHALKFYDRACFRPETIRVKIGRAHV